MTPSAAPPADRFVATLAIVAHEGEHLAYSLERLFSERIDADWVRGLEKRPEIAERLEAFVSRFGRMQDTIAGKLLPRWLAALAEEPGSQIETLNRAERLGVLDNVDEWLEARALRNRLVHEYMEDEASFAEDLRLAQRYAELLLATYGRVRRYASERMDLSEESLPASLDAS